MASRLIREEVIPLQGKLARMRFKQGLNLVTRKGSVKLFAKVKGNRVVDWVAIDEKGKQLPVIRKKVVVKGSAEESAVCRVCWTHGDHEHCYDVDMCHCRPAGCEVSVE